MGFLPPGKRRAVLDALAVLTDSAAKEYPSLSGGGLVGTNGEDGEL